MQLATFLQLLVGGLAMGAIYALVALGLYITHLTVGRVNFGQGDFAMAAAFLMLSARAAGLPLAAGALLVLAALAVLGLLLERVAIRPLDRQRAAAGGFSWILTTAGAAFILQNAIELAYGKSAQYSPPLLVDQRDFVIHFLGAGLAVEQLLVIAVAGVLVSIFHLFMFHSRWGSSILTVAFNPEVAQLLGIDTRLIKTAVFAVASVLAGVAGILMGPLVTVHPHMGLVFTIKALIVAAIGGFSHPAGILIGALLFGAAESASNYLDSTYGDLYPLIAALALIAIRPSGLFGERSADVR